MKSGYFAFFLSLLVAMGCKTRPVVDDYEDAEEVYEADEPLMEAPGTYPYRPSAKKSFDLIHTRLDLAFDWTKQEVQGKAFLKMKPWFHPASEVILDAKGFVIHDVLRRDGAAWVPLRHEYDLRKLKVSLDKNFSRQQELELQILYTARPNGLDTLVPEAEEERGIYFINADGSTPGKPKQIWTQGETHGASAWFPTFDQPNVRCTQEMYITVPDSFITLSNGLLTGSTKDFAGFRTDHWEMKLPHAPYLFMLTVGQFSKTTDTWRGKEVSYYVEPKYEPYARLIFGNTPEMLEFFSNKLGVAYPWEKYAQIVVRDFVSGAMENTSATIHYGGLQHDAREHVDDTQEDFISHELFHQWFGDLVTCESWANLTLNEGFATYGEYLWKEYKYGRDAADFHLSNDLEGYLGEASYSRKNLIRYEHDQPDDMFDAHSYQKGGRVLHMLRDYLGDAVFFESLKQYLTKHAFTDVEVAELRMAFEDVSGEDLNWFFDQWFMGSGHPELEITHIRGDSGDWKIFVGQLQDEPQKAFRFPVRLAVQRGGAVETREVWVESADTVFVIPADGGEIKNVVFDQDQVLLAGINMEDKPVDAWGHQLMHGTTAAQKRKALYELSNRGHLDSAQAAHSAALRHPFWALRRDAIAVTMFDETHRFLERESAQLVRMMRDPHPEVRTQAIEAMNFFAPGAEIAASDSLKAAIEDGLVRACRDSSYAVQSAGLNVLAAFSEEKARAELIAAAKNVTPYNAAAIVNLLSRFDSEAAMDLVERYIGPEQDQSTRWELIRTTRDMIAEGKSTLRAIDLLKRLASSDPNWWFRFASLNSLNFIRDKVPGLRSFFEERQKLETEPVVKAMIDRMLSEQW